MAEQPRSFPSLNRIQILWRDDESYVHIGVFGADDPGDVECEITPDGEYFVDSDLTFYDGEIFQHKGRHFRLTIKDVTPENHAVVNRLVNLVGELILDRNEAPAELVPGLQAAIERVQKVVDCYGR